MAFGRKNRHFFTPFFLALLMTSACKPSGGFSGAGGKKDAEATPVQAVESFTIGEPGSGKVDLALFLDTSDSMNEERAALLAGFQRFVDSLADGDGGLDYQVFIVGLTSKISVNLKDKSRLDMRNSEVNSHSGLWNAYHFLEGNTDKVPSGTLRLRPEAIKELLFLTDDDATGITAANFGPYLRDNAKALGSVRVNGFVGLPTSATSDRCKVAAIGQSYISLGEDPKIGGTIADICNSDWDSLLSDLAEQVRSRSGRGTAVYLKGKPPAAKLTVTVDGAAFNAYTYDAAKGKLTLDPTKLSGGAKSHSVQVSYSL